MALPVGVCSGTVCATGDAAICLMWRGVHILEAHDSLHAKQVTLDSWRDRELRVDYCMIDST